MTIYEERLWPSPWMLVSAALIIPASLLVFLPINRTAGVVVAVVLYAACVAGLLLSAGRIRVTDSILTAGRAAIPAHLLGSVTSYAGSAARDARGTELDARAYLSIRGWIDAVCKIEVVDAGDPTPYWLLSTRHPEALAEAISTARKRTPSK